MISHEKVEEALEKFNEKIDDFVDYFGYLYRIIPPSSFGIISSLVTIFSITFAIFLYLLVDPTFSLFSHLISYLGVGPNGSSIVFNIGLMISSLFLFLYLMHSVRDFRSRAVNSKVVDIYCISAILTTFGAFFVAIVPYQPAEFLILHGIVAGIFFCGGFLLSLLYTILALITPRMSKFQAFFGLFTASILIWHLINVCIGLIFSGFDFGGAGLFYLTEWLALFAMVFLIIEISIYFYSDTRLLHNKLLPEHTIDNEGLNNTNISKLRKYIKSIHTTKN